MALPCRVQAVPYSTAMNTTWSQQSAALTLQRDVRRDVESHHRDVGSTGQHRVSCLGVSKDLQAREGVSKPASE